jgi:uncharacterized protein YbaR (Trm112 family)
MSSPPATTPPPEDLSWIEGVLPLLRCPDTRQPLRWATAEEIAAAGLPADAPPALSRMDGSRLFPVAEGIPVLLPETSP